MVARWERLAAGGPTKAQSSQPPVSRKVVHVWEGLPGPPAIPKTPQRIFLKSPLNPICFIKIYPCPHLAHMPGPAVEVGQEGTANVLQVPASPTYQLRATGWVLSFPGPLLPFWEWDNNPTTSDYEERTEHTFVQLFEWRLAYGTALGVRLITVAWGLMPSLTGGGHTNQV